MEPEDFGPVVMSTCKGIAEIVTNNIEMETLMKPEWVRGTNIGLDWPMTRGVYEILKTVTKSGLRQNAQAASREAFTQLLNCRREGRRMDTWLREISTKVEMALMRGHKIDQSIIGDMIINNAQLTKEQEANIVQAVGERKDMGSVVSAMMLRYGDVGETKTNRSSEHPTNFFRVFERLRAFSGVFERFQASSSVFERLHIWCVFTSSVVEDVFLRKTLSFRRRSEDAPKTLLSKASS